MHASNVNNEQYTGSERTTRREILQGAIGASYLMMIPSIANADNLPSSNGADLSKTGTIDTLIPIVKMQQGISNAKSQLNEGSSTSSSLASPQTCTNLLQTLLTKSSIPRDEKQFKRIFDEYSTPVSYKQKFLDNNAFLVYYTKGYDGPGRGNIEDDATNNIQTMQYGARNDVWAAMDELYVELEYGGKQKDGDSSLSSEGELVVLIDKVLKALDGFLSFAPVADVEEAKRQLWS